MTIDIDNPKVETPVADPPTPAKEDPKPQAPTDLSAGLLAALEKDDKEVKADPESQKPEDPKPKEEPDKKEPEPPTTEVPETPTPEEVEDGIEKEGDEYVFRPESAEGTIYRGKTKKELFANVAKGITEKDATIQRLKVDRINSDSLKNKIKDDKEDESGEIEFPSTEKVYSETFKKLRIPIETLNWTAEDWKAAEVKDGAVATIELKNSMREAARIADATIARGNQKALNIQVVNDETEAVQDILVNANIDPDKFATQYEEILRRVWADDKNKNKAGILKSGSIAKEVAKAIMGMKITARTEEARKKSAQEVAEAAAKLKKLDLPTPVKTDLNKPPSKPPKDFDEAAERMVKMLNEGH